MRRAVFLDRDGVLVREHGRPNAGDLELLPGVAAALSRLEKAGLLRVVVTNQAIIARGLAGLHDIEAAHARLSERLMADGASLDAFYICPHHPSADMLEYRTDCTCRKPRPGMLERAQREHDVALERSFMVGDRVSDIVAGSRAGCRTILVETGAHRETPIESPDGPVVALPDHTCADLSRAVDWILAQVEG